MNNYFRLKENEKKNMCAMLIVLVCMYILFGLLSYVKGNLDQYLSMVIPVFVVTVTIAMVAIYRKTDLVLSYIVIALIVFGCFIQSIVSDDPYKYGLMQLLTFILGCTLLFVFTRFMEKYDKKKRKTVYLGLIVLIYVVLLVFGTTINGTTAWIHILGYSFQLTEITKLLSILYFSESFNENNSDFNKIADALIIMAINTVFLFILKELGTLFILFVICLFYLFISLKNIRYFIYVVLTLLIAALIMYGTVYYLNVLLENGHENTITQVGTYIYRKLSNRLQLFFSPESVSEDLSYQMKQARKAILLGGAFGCSYDVFVPVQTSDMIFASIVLRVGNIAAIFITLLFVVFIIKGLLVSQKSNNYLKYGFTLSIGVQALLVIFANYGYSVLMGLPIAFISEGNTYSLILYFMIMYMLFNRKKSIENKGEEKICRIIE